MLLSFFYFPDLPVLLADLSEDVAWVNFGYCLAHYAPSGN
jgi:hypothetical protein